MAHRRSIGLWCGFSRPLSGHHPSGGRDITDAPGLTDDYAEDRITRRFRDRALSRIERERERWLSELHSLASDSLTSRYSRRHGALLEAWDTLSVDQQRQIIGDASGQVTIAPFVVGGAPRFDPERVSFGT